MKYRVWQILVFVITFVLYYFLAELHVPFILSIILILPLLGIAMFYLAFVYSFRSNLQLEFIPEKGYESRINEIKNQEKALLDLGFAKIDEFYLKTIPDSITFMYKQKDLPTYSYIYHFGKKMALDIVSYFPNDITLSTCSSSSAGSTPRSAKKLLQICENVPFSNQLTAHMNAMSFLKQHHLDPLNISNESCRDNLMKSILDQAKFIRSQFLWPVKVFYWALAKPGLKIYKKPIQEQYPSGINAILM